MQAGHFGVGEERADALVANAGLHDDVDDLRPDHEAGPERVEEHEGREALLRADGLAPHHGVDQEREEADEGARVPQHLEPHAVPIYSNTNTYNIRQTDETRKKGMRMND